MNETLKREKKNGKLQRRIKEKMQGFICEKGRSLKNLSYEFSISKSGISNWVNGY